MSARISDLGSSWPGILGIPVTVADANCGITTASPASIGTAQPMPYRSPEILFGLQWSKEVDIWGWGMVVGISLAALLRPN
jgi:hypothetical protein